MTNTIAFPGLGIGAFTIPKGFSFFGIDIRFYGVLIALGIVLAFLFCKKKGAKRGVVDDTLVDIIIWGLPSAVI
ncbi:MAG: prolipoprotein diacylglyceryl transferase, partial [Clostridia bacterium]|nr:prolipoprotein diacylglyceryl transferase [Clostridia bacterium]